MGIIVSIADAVCFLEFSLRKLKNIKYLGFIFLRALFLCYILLIKRHSKISGLNLLKTKLHTIAVF